MNILITGSTGFVGKNLTKYLESLGHYVKGINREDIGDFKEVKDWTPFLKNIDVVIHTAGRAHRTNDNSTSSENIYTEENVIITKRIAEASIRSNVNKFIFLSSSKVYGEFSKIPFTELDQCFPQDSYAKSKLSAENELLKFANCSEVTFIILRPPLIYGKGVKANFQSLMNLTKLLPILPIGNFRAKRSYLNINNLCNFLSICIKFNHTKKINIFNISDTESFTLADVISTLARNSNKKILIFPFPIIFFKYIFKLIGRSDIFSKLYSNFEIDSTLLYNTYNWSPPYKDFEKKND